jgi:hypothetical protein
MGDTNRSIDARIATIRIDNCLECGYFHPVGFIDGFPCKTMAYKRNGKFYIRWGCSKAMKTVYRQEMCGGPPGEKAFTYVPIPKFCPFIGGEK